MFLKNEEPPLPRITFLFSLDMGQSVFMGIKTSDEFQTAFLSVGTIPFQFEDGIANGIANGLGKTFRHRRLLQKRMISDGAYKIVRRYPFVKGKSGTN